MRLPSLFIYLLAIALVASQFNDSSNAQDRRSNVKASAAIDDDESSAKEKSMTGKVTKVIDGDSIIVVDEDNKEHEVQIEGTDAPEAKQPFGKESTEALTKLVKDEKVRVTWTKTDNYDRLLGQVYKGDEHCNLTMIQTGFAWHFKKYNNSKVLAEAEEQAKSKKLGLWGTEDPIAPWDFRSKNKTPDRPSKE